MHQLNLACLTERPVGSATTMVNRNIRQQSIGVAVKHHAPTYARFTNRQHQNKTISKKINKKPVLIYVEFHKLFIKCFG